MIAKTVYFCIYLIDINIYFITLSIFCSYLLFFILLCFVAAPTPTITHIAYGGSESLLEMTFSGSVPDINTVFYITDTESPFHDGILYYRVPVGVAAVKSGDANTLVLNIQNETTVLQIYNNGAYVDNFGSATEYSALHDPQYFEPNTLTITTTDPAS